MYMSLKPIWKWSFGEPQEKSPRRCTAPTPPTAAAALSEEEEVLPPAAEYSRGGGLRSVSITAASPTLTPQEELYDRINHREKIVQIGQNPFHQTNYMEDIVIQDRFLRGKLSGTNAEKSGINT